MPGHSGPHNSSRTIWKRSSEVSVKEREAKKRKKATNLHRIIKTDPLDLVRDNREMEEYIYIYYIHPELRIGNCLSGTKKGVGPL